MEIVYFIYGLSFFLMGVLIAAKRKKGSAFAFSREFNLLAAFAIIHGVGEWTEMFRLVYRGTSHREELHVLEEGGILLMLVSFIFLLIFGLRALVQAREDYGRRHLKNFEFILWGGAILISSLFMSVEYEGMHNVLHVLSRYLIALPATLIISYSAFVLSRRVDRSAFPKIKNSLVGLGFFFFLYGLSSGLVVPRADFFPASFLNYESFQAAFGFPIQLVRSVLALLITVFIIGSLRIFNMEEERKATEQTIKLRDAYERLEKAEHFSHVILENLGEGIVVLDKDFRIHRANQYMLNLIKMDMEEVVGKQCYRLIHKKEEVCSDCAVARTFETGEPSFTQHTGTAKDGSVTHVELYSYPIKEEGRVSRVIEKVVDVSHRLKMEDRLRHSQKMGALGVLASGVAHEIGNPLASISSLAQIIERKTQDSFIREKLRLMMGSIDRISKIVRDFLDFSKPAPSRFEEVDVVPILESVVHLSQYDKRFAQVKIIKQYEAGLPRISAGSDGLHQVFMNFMLNAADAVKGRADGRIDIIAANSDGHVNITFQDNGIGMDEEEQSKIFEPFFTSKEPGEGMGLGLFVSYGIVKTFGGRIAVESEKGKGTVFRLRFPVST